VDGRVSALSFQTVAELRYGAIKAEWGERRSDELERRIRRFVVLSPDDETVSVWATLRASAEQRGLQKQIGDLWIAATAKRHGIPLLTRDAGFYEGLDIPVIKPEDPPKS
jgi:tRNA(fMet)-specific endonuclease VapC